jgi:hypothetical protein
MNTPRRMPRWLLLVRILVPIPVAWDNRIDVLDTFCITIVVARSAVP